jgi:hypothetical protein
MPTGPKGEHRPADVIGNAVHVMKILTGASYGRTELWLVLKYESADTVIKFRELR